MKFTYQPRTTRERLRMLAAILRHPVYFWRSLHWTDEPTPEVQS